ncbi:MAG: DUF4129 domain-containing protein [Bacteroidota bacterium]
MIELLVFYVKDGMNLAGRTIFDRPISFWRGLKYLYYWVRGMNLPAEVQKNHPVIRLINLSYGLLVLLVPAVLDAQQEYTTEYEYEQPTETYTPPVNTAIAEEVALQPFDEEALDDLRNTFDYTKPTERKKKKKQPEEERRREQPGREEAEEEADNSWEIGELKIPAWLGWVVLAVLLGVIGFFIYRALGLLDDDAAKKKKKTADRMQVDLSEVPEEQLTLKETETLLQRAERTGDFTAAVRMQYLAMLKELNELSLIEYKRDKTDREYRREMDETDLGDEFAAITIDYARNWYGQYPLDRLSYRLVAERFESLRAKLSTVKKSAYA